MALPTWILAMTLAGLACSSAYPAMSVVPDSPTPLDTVRLSAGPNDLPPSFRPDLTTVAMAANRITVILGIQGVNTLPPPNPPLDLPLGRFPAGQYQVEVVSGDTSRTFPFTVQAVQPSMPAIDYTDLWWNPDQSGWGLNVVQHPSGNLFATWFVYDIDGSAGWYVVPSGTWGFSGRNGNCLTSCAYTGPVYRTSGPALGRPVDPSQVSRTRVGTAELAFGAYNALHLTITIDGAPFIRDLQRQGF
jgi:hypothetical protein